MLKSGASGSVSINALVAALSAGMRALPEDQVIQTNGCRLLAHMAVKDSNQLAIAKECGVKAVLEAMKKFPSDSAVQESGCRVLGLLSYNCMLHSRQLSARWSPLTFPFGLFKAETQQYITRLGGTEATLAAMRDCVCAEVLVAACGTLTCLAMTGYWSAVYFFHVHLMSLVLSVSE